MWLLAVYGRANAYPKRFKCRTGRIYWGFDTVLPVIAGRAEICGLMADDDWVSY